MSPSPRISTVLFARNPSPSLGNTRATHVLSQCGRNERDLSRCSPGVSDLRRSLLALLLGGGVGGADVVRLRSARDVRAVRQVRTRLGEQRLQLEGRGVQLGCVVPVEDAVGGRAPLALLARRRGRPLLSVVRFE